MKLSSTSTRAGNRGFTLIEMIGVLAVIAILAAMLLPKVFSAINDSRVNNSAVSIETVKTSATDHYGKYNKLSAKFGTNDLGNAIANYDTTILMAEGLLDKPFATKIADGTNAIVHLVAGGAENAGGGFQLDGTVSTITTNQAQVLEAVLYNVTAQDAKDLNDRVDGIALGGASVGAADAKGRVEYAAGPTTTVYVYLTGR